MKKIIVFRFSAMGDVAMAVPVLQVLTKTHSGVEVSIVSKPFFEPLFKDLPNVTFIGADVKKQYKGITGLYRLHKELKKLQPDYIADLHDVIRTKILDLFFKSGGYKLAVIDKGRAEKKALTTEKNKQFKALKSTHERYADVFRKLGFSIDLDTYQPIQSKLNNQVKLFLDTFEGQKLVGIAPFAAHTGKQYPLDKVKEIIKLLLEQESGLSILLFGGGAKEKQQLEKLEAIDRNRIVNTPGVFSFEEELQIISRLNLMLSMDSGNGHLAAIYGVPVVTIWGATHPYAGFAPFRQTEAQQILPDLKRFKQLPTSVYGNKTFEGFEAVWESISPEEVVQKIKQNIY